MCKTDKESYETYWDDISPFIKYGCLKDTKFCDKMNDYILFKNLDDKYLTLPELLVKEEEKKEDADAASDVVDKDGNSVTEDADAKDDSEEEKDERKVIYYVTDKVQQGQYIKLFKEQGMDAVILDHNIDTSFISQLEPVSYTHLTESAPEPRRTPSADSAMPFQSFPLNADTALTADTHVPEASHRAYRH